ncbi:MULTISPECIES: Ig-like domain-containing protein [unclassified Nocardioides]|uniref:Ig-like domain-containing protein n=1 Tax=unclassified Nocardioides TaxID=2615069 RepID=UPI0030146B8F
MVRTISPRKSVSRGVLAFALSSAMTVTALAPLSAMAQEPRAAGPVATATAKAGPVATTALAKAAQQPQSSEFAQQLESKYVDPDRVYSTDVRWWLGEAANTDESLLEEVQALYDAGYRGVELCMQSDAGAPDSDYAYGSPMWTHKWNLMMNKLLDLGMAVYLTSGTNWATSNVPGLDPTSQQAMQNLTLGTGTVEAGQTLTTLPAPAVANRKAGARFVTAYAYKVTEGDTVDPSSYINLKPSITQGADAWTQNLSWTAPNDGTYRVFGMWTQGTFHSSSPSAQPAYATNYFDKRGVEALRAYWEEHYLADPALREKIAKGDVQLFMDSLEINTGTGFTWWSEDMVAEFQKRKGYDITPYLFLISGVAATPFTPYHEVRNTGTYKLNGQEQRRQGIINDYQDVLTQLYRERLLQPLKTWLNGVGIETRAQISYGRPLEMSEPAMDVDYPEAENFNQYNNVDIFRLWTGGAKLENKVLSSETGAQLPAYNGTRQMDVHDAYSAYAAGFQRMVWHVWGSGYSYGSYQWPGHNSTGFRQLGTRNPGYSDYDEFNAHLGRVQQLVQTGKSRTDVGFINQKWVHGVAFNAGVGSDNGNMNWQYAHQGVYYRSTELQDNGYTYDYFSPKFLFDDDVHFDERTKTIEKAGYQAIVLYQSWLDIEAAKRVLSWAKKGLKVVILEDAASRTPFNDGKDGALKKVTDELKTLPTVRQATVYDDIDYFSSAAGGYDDNVLEKLQELGVEPYSGYSEPNLQLLTQTREDAEGNQYLYVYNYDPADYLDKSHKPSVRAATHGQNIKTDIVQNGLFVPYTIDAWTGETTERADYRWEDGKTIVPIDLDYDNIALLAFEKVDGERLHVLSSNADSAYAVHHGVVVRTTGSGTVNAELSNGERIAQDVRVPAAYDIEDWDLTVESWRPGATAGDLTRTETIDGLTTTNRKTSTVKTDIDVELDTLTTWDQIPAVGKGVSGKGHYEASFDWDAGSASGAYLDFGDKLEESMVVWINGKKVGGEVSTNPTKVRKDVGGVGKPTIDDGRGNQVPLVGSDLHTGGISWTKPIADVSDYLVDGKNDIVIEYSSALANVQLDRGIVPVQTPKVGRNGVLWWHNDQKYLSNGPQQAKIVPFVDVEYVEATASSVSATPVAGTYGTATTVTATVTGTAPSGTVTVSQGARVLGTGTVSDGTARITLAGTALGAGTHALTVAYSGDGANAASSVATTARIAKARSSVKASLAPKRPKAGTRPTVKVVVTVAGVRPGGKVLIRRAGRTVETGTLNAAGKVNLRLPKQKAGSRKYRVRYQGNANISGGSKLLTVRVTRR